MRHAATDWLKKECASRPSVARAYLFGSVLIEGADLGDVDVVLVFDRIDSVRDASAIAKRFSDAFGIMLHVQKFYSAQENLITRFLQKAERAQCIYEQGSPS